MLRVRFLGERLRQTPPSSGNMPSEHRRQTPFPSAVHPSGTTHVPPSLTIVSTHCAQTPLWYSTHSPRATHSVALSRTEPSGHPVQTTPSVLAHSAGAVHTPLRRTLPLLHRRHPSCEQETHPSPKTSLHLAQTPSWMKNSSTQETAPAVVWTSAVLDFEHGRSLPSVDSAQTPHAVPFAHDTHIGGHALHDTPSANSPSAHFTTWLFVAANAFASSTSTHSPASIVSASSHSRATLPLTHRRDPAPHGVHASISVKRPSTHS